MFTEHECYRSYRCLPNTSVIYLIEVYHTQVLLLIEVYTTRVIDLIEFYKT